VNCNLSGEILTADELTEIAVSTGIRTEQQLSDLRASFHNLAMFRSTLLTLTQKERHGMFMRGELTLRTAVRTL
jgi:hypothetical protein